MITITVNGEERLIASLATLAHSWIDFRRIESKISQVFHRFEKEQFSGSEWEPLDPDYEARKAQRYPGKPIMRRTDALFNQLTGDAGIKRVTQSEIELGAGGQAGIYGGFHQVGAGVPQRKVIDIKESQFRAFGEVVENDAIAFARKEGFEVIAA